MYDFGDNWRHTVRLLDVLRRDFKTRYPRCVGGARACPPEDSGGVHRYMECLTIDVRLGNSFEPVILALGLYRKGGPAII